MPDKPLCPYCGPWNGHPDGVEMVLRKWELNQRYDSYWFECVECDSVTPHVELHRSMAHEAGRITTKRFLRRFHPMQKPLTLKEVKELQREPVYLVSLGEDFEDGWQLCVAADSERLHCLMFYTILLFKHYGKTWIAYRCEPTDEERAAAKWEEI